MFLISVEAIRSLGTSCKSYVYPPERRIVTKLQNRNNSVDQSPVAMRSIGRGPDYFLGMHAQQFLLMLCKRRSVAIARL
jgi:hypothetical protein